VYYLRFTMETALDWKCGQMLHAVTMCTLVPYKCLIVTAIFSKHTSLVKL